MKKITLKNKAHCHMMLRSMSTEAFNSKFNIAPAIIQEMLIEQYFIRIQYDCSNFIDIEINDFNNLFEIIYHSKKIIHLDRNYLKQILIHN